jgi:hypothetical protein
VTNFWDVTLTCEMWADEIKLAAIFTQRRNS